MCGKPPTCLYVIVSSCRCKCILWRASVLFTEHLVETLIILINTQGVTWKSRSKRQQKHVLRVHVKCLVLFCLPLQKFESSGISTKTSVLRRSRLATLTGGPTDRLDIPYIAKRTGSFFAPFLCESTNTTPTTLLVHLKSDWCLWFSDSGCFYGYIGWRRGWRAGVRHGVCHGAVVLVAYVLAGAQVKGMTLTRAYRVLPLTALREKTAESAPNTVSRKRVVLYRSHLRHTLKHGTNNTVDCKVSFYTKFLLTYWSETSASTSSHYCNVMHNLYFRYSNNAYVRNTKTTL